MNANEPEATGYPASLHPDCPDLRRLAGNAGEAMLRAEAEAVTAEDAAEYDRYRELSLLEDAQEDGRGVTRRRFIIGAAGTATTLATSQFISTRASFAATSTGTLIHVFLLGGMDGLSLLAPGNDGVLRSVRPNFALGGDAIPLDRGFVMSSAFAPLDKYRRAGQLAFIPGVSDAKLSRSHFDAQDLCQLGGVPSTSNGRGWLDRLVGTLGPGTAFRGIGVGSTLPLSLVGENGALAINKLAEFNVNGESKYRAATTAAIAKLFTGINHPGEQAVKAGIGALATAQRLARQRYNPANGVRYEGGLGNSFRELAQLIKGGANIRVAAVGVGGWDTHENQGTPQPGNALYDRLNAVASGMAAFFDDLGPTAAADVTVMVSSEFGRRVANTGSGTDHGHGGVVTILSGRKLAGSVLGNWGGLGNLDRGDVPEYNNMFNVFGSVAQGRFGLSDAEVASVFPGRRYSPMRLYA